MNSPAADSVTPPSSETPTDGTPRPPLKWAGGKRWLVPTLRKLLREHVEKPLVEPFAGGLAVTLGLLPSRALLNDRNPHLINFYQHIQQGLSLSRDDLRNEREFFFEQRTRFNRLVKEGAAQSAEAARIFYYLNRTCFNGLCRFNSKGEFNVPFGRYTSIAYATDFNQLSRHFTKWAFSCADFEELSIKDDDVLYVDPPYDVEFTKYSKEDFTWSDQERLVEWLKRHTNPMVISNQATERIINLYNAAGFRIEKIAGPRRISCTGDREPAWEMLAYRNL